MALFDEMAAETEAEEARKRRERERKAAAAANGKGNGANAVTSASFGLDGDDPEAEPDVPSVSQTDYTAGYVPSKIDNAALSQVAQGDLAAAYADRDAPTTVDRYGHLPEEDQNAISAAETYWLPRLENDPEKAYENYKSTMGATGVSDSVKQFYRDNAPAEFSTRYNNELSQGARADLAAGYEGRILDKYFPKTETQPLYFENELREAMKDPSSDEA